MRLIPLTQGKFTKVDDEDYARLSQFKWYYANGTACRGVHTPGNTSVKQWYIYWDIIGRKEGHVVDHRNRDRLDNTRANLRHATRRQNCINTHNSSGTTGVRGVSRISKYAYKKPWKSRIRIDGKLVFLGYFATKEEAARAYDQAARCYHGEFAVLNYPSLSNRPA